MQKYKKYITLIYAILAFSLAVLMLNAITSPRGFSLIITVLALVGVVVMAIN